MLDRISHAVHTAPLAKTLMWEHVGSEAGRFPWMASCKRTEDPTKGFKFGGWEMPYFDQEFGEELDRVFKEKIRPPARPQSCATSPT
jgi:hypothetical protein